MSIKWGNYIFDGPYQIDDWNPPYRAAVYAVMKGTEQLNTFTVIYFGESGNLSQRGFVESHHKYPCFIEQAGYESNLYIGIYLMSDSTEYERHQIESALISQYHPVCNG